MRQYLVYESEASRWELLIRWVYTQFIFGILAIYTITRQICFGLQALGILILGTRSESLTNVLIGHSEFIIQVIPYVFLLTDERPNVMPKELKVFLNNREYLNFEESASRVELIVRIFYAIPVMIILPLFGFVAGFVLALQWLCILFTGGRSEGLNNFIRTFVLYIIQIISYFSLVTDERPSILPENMDVSLELGSDEVGTATSGGVTRTNPPLSRSTKDKHVAIGIILIFLQYIAIYLLYFFLLLSMISYR